MVTKIAPLMTVADLDVTPDDGNRYEVIEGELFVSCAPGISHQRIVHNLQMALGSYLVRNPIGIVIPAPGVIFSELSGVIPDLVYVSQARQQEIAAGARVTGAPDLVLEVLSPGAENARRDRIVKLQLTGSIACLSTGLWIQSSALLKCTVNSRAVWSTLVHSWIMTTSPRLFSQIFT